MKLTNQRQSSKRGKKLWRKDRKRYKLKRSLPLLINQIRNVRKYKRMDDFESFCLSIRIGMPCKIASKITNIKEANLTNINRDIKKNTNLTSYLMFLEGIK